jgi:hypothetical protein
MFMVGLWLATVLPLVALLAWGRPVLVLRWRRARLVSRVGLVGLWLAAAGLMVFFPHEDNFTGLDNMTYRQMAHAFLGGRGFHDPDTILAEVPENLREDFLFHRGPVGRPTRDRVFQLSGWNKIQVEPFFLPVLPLAAAGQDPLFAPERFVPLIGALWMAVVLMAGFCAGGGWGVVVVAALMLGTAWPAWCLRGFYAEGVGAVLATSVVAVATLRPLRGGMAGVAGFALGLSMTYHPTMLVLSVPIALGLALERGEWKYAMPLLGGVLMGALPVWVVNRFVCQPYGNITSWDHVRQIAASAPEHRAVAVVVCLMVLISVVALFVGLSKPARIWVSRTPVQWRRGGWLLVCALPLILLGALQGYAGETLRAGAVSVWSGIRWPCGLLLLAGGGVVLLGRRPWREQFWLASLFWGAVFFLFLQGVEIPVGLWSQRRFLPVILMGIALLAAPLSERLAEVRGRWRVAILWVLVVLAGTSNLIRWPAAFVTINEMGSAAFTREIAERIGTNRWVVFDSYPHSVPYAAGLKPRVLGLNEPSWSRWPEVADWITLRAQDEEVWVATAWTPCPLEEGVKLEPVFSLTGRFAVVKAKMFFPAEREDQVIQDTFLRVIPLADGEMAAQNKVLDGSPIGLRGPWGQLRGGATWSRQGSGIIGPIPPRGGQVLFEVDGSWTAPNPEWVEQVLRVTPPWGGEVLTLKVPIGDHAVSGPLVRPANDKEREETGTYTLSVERPYDPAEYGLRRYSKDLGVGVKRIAIQNTEP